MLSQLLEPREEESIAAIMMRGQQHAIAVGTADYESAVRFASSIRGDADTLAAITGSISQALWGLPKAIREQSLAITARCYPGMERTVAEFEARFGGF